ncbi:MAG: GtrA family protein [Erysipelotrichaceae bacterium]|jgi:putative flippase GtrA|nr:GtrA family protein [Erysipelotrichaceae bacterium]
MEKKNPFLQFIQFGVVGVINTTVHTVLYNIALPYTGYGIAQTIGFFVSSVGGFLLNKFFVFENKDKDNSMIVRYYCTYIFSYCLMMALSYFYEDILKLDLNFLIPVLGKTVNILPLMTLVVTVPVNFFLSKFWVYKKKEA